MTDVLTPQLALAYLAELQPSLSAVAILDEKGRLLAGEDPGDAPPTLTVAREGYEIRAVAGPGAAAGAGAVAGAGAPPGPRARPPPGGRPRPPTPPPRP